MKRTKKPDAKLPPYTLRNPDEWVKDPRALVWPSESKSINYAAFKKTVDKPSPSERANRLKNIEASLLIMRADLHRLAERPVYIPPALAPRAPWWRRLWRTLFMAWAAE